MASIDNTGTRRNKNPNFLLIVVLAGIFLIFALLTAFFTIDWDGKRLVPRAFGKHNHPTSQLIRPDGTPTSRRA